MRGGMGEIWRGTDLMMKTLVAIKRVPSQNKDPGADLNERLIREGRAIAAVDHENVVKLVTAELDQAGNPYLVIEWLDGENLDQRRQRAPLSTSEVLDVIRQTLCGLAACHAEGIVHRDIKPANIFLQNTQTGPRVKLLDFGLALLGENATRLTRAGDVMGTLQYLSPEQARGIERSSHRTDIYSVGVVLYEMVTGRPPFRAEKPLAVLLKIVTEMPPRPQQFRPDLPRWLERVIVRAMQREPADRFESAEQMLEALGGRLERTRASMPSIPKMTAVEAEADTIPPTTPAAPEYRLVSLLCVQLHDRKTVLSELTEPMERAHGLVYQLLGGQVVSIFGLDRTLGDEAQRALQTGLALRAALGSRASLLVATVHLLFGEGLQLNSDDLDRSTTLLAEVQAGDLQIDDRTQQVMRERVKIKRIGKRHVVQSLVPSGLAQRPVLGIKTPTVGRDHEIAQLHAAFSTTLNKAQAQYMLLSGPAGVGKTRLARELTNELRNCSVLNIEARATPSRRQTPYNLLADALGALAGFHLLEDEDARRRALRDFINRYVQPQAQERVTMFLGEAIGLPLLPTTIEWSDSVAERFSALRIARNDPRVMREKIISSIEQLLTDASREGAVSVLLEDLHWADEESLLVFGALLPRVAGKPLFALATARPEFLIRGAAYIEQFVHIELAPLEASSMRRLLRAILGRVAEDYEVQMLRWCAGNPYFLEELVSWMVADKLLVFSEDGWRLKESLQNLELPASIEAAIQGRLDRLGPELKELLKAASVMGESFWQQGCEALGFENCKDNLVRLASLELVEPQAESRFANIGQWAFRHPLAQQVAYSMVPHQRRQKLHLEAARWLEEVGEPDAAALAYHFAQGGDKRLASAYQARVAERALADGDLDRAVSCFENAIETAPADLENSERAGRMLGLARAYILRGASQQAWQLLDQLDRRCTGDPTRSAELLLLRGRLLLIRTRYQEAETLLSNASDALDRVDAVDLAFEAKHSLFWTIWVQGRYDDAGPLAEQMHRESSPSRPDHLCSAKLASAFHNIVCGDLSAAIILSEQAYAHANDVGHPYREVDALAALGSAQEIVGLYDAARASFSSALSLADRLKTAHHQASLQACLGRIALTLKDPTTALKRYLAAVRDAEQVDDSRTLAIALSGEARARARIKSPEDLRLAHLHARRAVKLTANQAPPEEAEANLALSEAHAASGDRKMATAVALEAVSILDALGTHELYEVEILLNAYHALSSVERTDEAMQMLARAWRAIDQRRQRISVPAVRRSFEENVPHHRSVQQLWQRFGGSSPR
jgi:tetratricopeptide (TPR) repeat protein/tRNA A-37 threonylcarbamoyl transferase component Bud32/DNA polymerase III delta prime subunit